MIWYFYQSQNKITEKKGKIKQKKKNKRTYLEAAQLASRGPPSWPSPRTPLSSSTPRCQAAQWQGADAVDATATPSTFQAAPCPLLMSRSTTRQPCLTSPSSPVLSLPLRDFPFSPESFR